MSRQLNVLAASLLVLCPFLLPSIQESSVDAAENKDKPNTAPAVKGDSDKVDFRRDIKPILVARCFKCHGPAKREGGLRFTSYDDLLHLNDSGEPAAVPGKSKQSELLRRVLSKDDDERMPPADAGKRLSAKDVELLRAWIDQGAVWPKSETIRPQHWAYAKPVREKLPKLDGTNSPRSAIDAFVLARIHDEGLNPSPPADRARLLRRVSLDLIGLPPSVEEVDAFIKDARSDAYERVVDRLLKSPRYGERWARQWLDLARYADSNGYQADQFRAMWVYRDWVIKAFNQDMPFDQFTIEQIAGDLLPKATLDQKIATGFHRCPTCNVEAGVDPEENRVNQLIDRVNTTGTVWLGTTLECAQCHNHKYDPFTQKDYYQLFAYFNNTPLEVKQAGGRGVTYDFYGPKMELPLPEDQATRRRELQGRAAGLAKQTTACEAVLTKSQADWEIKLAAVSKDKPQWHVLDVETFASAGGATHTVLDDKSVLVGGTNPDKDIYTVTVRTELTGITGFKIEALLDPSLPGKGPGRQTQGSRANFVLTEFRINAKSNDASSGQPLPVALTKPTADYANKQFPISNAIDGDSGTGWSIHTEYHKPHHATFLTAQPVGSEGSTTLTFTVEHQYGLQRAIGRLRLSAMTGQPKQSTVPGKIATILAIPSAKRNKKQQTELRTHYLSLDPELKQLRAEVAKVKKQSDAIKPVTTLVMIEADKSRMNNIFKRGNFLDKGSAVEPGVPTALHSLPDGAKANRQTLARWLVAPSNPLVGRVTVNRWWSEFFGRGIVESLEDFGTQGERPTHPKLLDWLAVEFVEQGWSMKHMHKLIVMSATYQQSSRVTPELLQRDPYNKLYARGSRVRLSAETIRDNALTISGLLSTKMAGPPVFPPQPPNIWRHIGRNAPKYVTSTGEDRFRRGVYVVWRRSAPYPSFVNFDAPDRASCVVQRSRTNTPLQALTLMNDPAYVEMAKALASRIVTEGSGMSVADRINYGFRLCLARLPKPAEAKFLETIYRTELARLMTNPKAAQALADNSVAKAATDSKTSVSSKPAAGQQKVAELAAWFYIANILLNLDETITKG